MSVPAFLANIKQECLLFHIDENKKKIFDRRCFGKGYTAEQVEALKQPNQHVGIMYDIKNTNYVVVDIDTNDYTTEDLFNDSDIDSCFVKGNTKGWHVWMMMKNKTEEFKKNRVDCGLYSTIDFLGEKVFECIGKEWIHDEACYLHEESITKTFKTGTFEKRLVSESKSTGSCNVKLLEKIIGLIDIKYCNNRMDWLKIILAMRKVGLSEVFADSWSKLSGGYTHDGFKTAWNSYTSNELITSTEGTIRYYAKKSSPTEYAKLTTPVNEQAIDIQRLINLKPVQPDEDPKMAMFNDLNKTAQNELKKQKEKQDADIIQEEIRMKIEYFEKFHFKVMNPACFGRIAYDKTNLLTASEIELDYENVNVGSKEFIPFWRKSHKIRTYENVDFLPYPKDCKSYTLNTFNGLKASRIKSGEGDYNIFLKHMKILTGHDEKGTEYLIDYLAHLVQKPGELPRVALVFQSEQGVGKNVFFENFAKQLLGIEYLLATADMDKVIGRFPMINNKLMVIMDETSGKDSFSNSDKIKNIITAEQVAWERKGIDGTSINNCGRYLFFSNNLTPVKIEQSDRRYVVFKCANDVQNKTDYFDELISAFNNEGTIKSFFDFLNTRDISKWDSINHRPMTKAYADIKSANTPPMATYLMEQMALYENADECDKDMYGKQPATDIFNNFKLWLTQSGFTKMDYTITKFGREICDYEGLEKKRVSSGVVYTIDYAKLKMFLEKRGWNV
jgi:hypothetical protein